MDVSRPHLQITDAPFDAAEALRAFEHRLSHESGAVVSFTGRVRSEAGNTEALELETYKGFIETHVMEMAQAAQSRHGLSAVAIIHRIGRIEVGETIVFVATAAPHRRAAFEGADQIMDFLKSRAPFWKKSYTEGEARWITPRDTDYVDAQRWDVGAPAQS